jgi:hypothetical protein
MREAAFDKGRRYLIEGRLRIQSVGDRHIVAVCRGDSGEMHTLTAEPLPLEGTGAEGMR